MTTTYFLSSDQYTWNRIAKLWWLGEGHWDIYTKETEWNKRAVIHCTAAVLEAIPILGHLIFLVEMLANNFWNAKTKGASDSGESVRIATEVEIQHSSTRKKLLWFQQLFKRNKPLT